MALGLFADRSEWSHSHRLAATPGAQRLRRRCSPWRSSSPLHLARAPRGGRARNRRERAASALALVALVPAVCAPRQSAARTIFTTRTPRSSRRPQGLSLNGSEVKNVFPYTRDGKPLNDVLLYLPDGQPLGIGAFGVDPNRRYLVDRRGQRLYNSFPARYFDPGTTRVTRPNAGPRVQIPDVLTPPLP